MKKTQMLKIAVSLLMVAFFLWVGFSWIDVIADNLNPNPTYSAWNCFRLLIGE